MRLKPYIGVRAFFARGTVNHLPKNSYKLPKFLRYSRKETRIIRCTNNSVHMKWKYSYIWIYHMSSKTLQNLKEIAVSSISTGEDVNDAIQVIVDYRVGIYPFNVGKCNVADTLLPHGATEVSFQLAQCTKWLLCWTRCSRYQCKDICTT